MTPRPRPHHDPHLPTSIGIGTGARRRLGDPGAARALAFAAEQLGYASVWAFDSPPGGRSVARNRPGTGTGEPSLDDLLATLAMFAEATVRVTIGAAITGHAWPLAPASGERLVAANDVSGGRVVVARPWSPATDSDAPGRSLQRWSPDEPALAAWADGWMVECWGQSRSAPSGLPPTGNQAGAGRVSTSGGIVVRLPVDEEVDRIVAEIAHLREAGATEIVLDVVADVGVDHALDLYSRIAESVETDLDRRTA